MIAGRDAIRVLLERPDGVDAAALARSVQAELPVTVETVDAIPRTALGKAPLVRRAISPSA